MEQKKGGIGKLVIVLIVAALMYFVGSKVIAPSMLSSDEGAGMSVMTSDSQAYQSIFTSRDLMAPIHIGAFTNVYAKGVGDTVYYVLVQYAFPDEAKTVTAMTVNIYEPLATASAQFREDVSCCTVKYTNSRDYRIATAEFSQIQREEAVKELYEKGIIRKQKALTVAQLETELAKQGFVKE